MRRKLSMTIAPQSYAYLQRLVKRGEARNLSRAAELAIERLHRAENRARLERDTAAYFAALSGKAAAEESRLEQALGQSIDEIDLES